MGFKRFSLGSTSNLKEIDFASDNISIADNANSVSYDPLLHLKEIQKSISSTSTLSPEDFLVSLPKDDPWLLTQKRIHAIKAKHEEDERLSEKEAKEHAKNEYLIKGLLGP